MDALWVLAILAAAWGSGYFFGMARESRKFREGGFAIADRGGEPWPRYGLWSSRGCAEDHAKKINEDCDPDKLHYQQFGPFGAVEIFTERKP